MDKKLPLSHFDERDVAKYAVAVFSQRSADDFEVIWSEDGVLVTSKKKNTIPQSRYRIKIGGSGLILLKDKKGNWSDKFFDRRMFYNESNNKLILSETFEGDSVAIHEFVK